MIALIKLAIPPGSPVTMLLLLGLGVLLLYARPRWGRVWLTLVVIAYWFFSSPIGAGVLTRSVDGGFVPLERKEDARGAQAVIVLGGGTANTRARGLQLSSVVPRAALRVIETARVYRLLGSPLVIVSGGVTDPLPGAPPESEAYRAAMLALGVPANRIVTESESSNTHDEAVVLKRLLGERHVDRFVLVTAPAHMRRAVDTFAAQGLVAVPSPAPLLGDRVREPWPFVPNDAAIDISTEATYEWLARAYYWARGWTRSAPPGPAP